MRLHWFNPENDLALAAGCTHYTAPKAPRRLSEAGATLPVWYANNGDQVLVPDHTLDQHQRWADTICRQFDIDVHLCPACDDRNAEAAPWGWSATARAQFARHGIDMKAMPNDAEIQHIRELSHRRTAAHVARKLAQLLPDMPLTEPATEIHSQPDLERLLAEHSDVVIKSPWSGSGRGVAIAATCGVPTALNTGYDSIRLQGSVMVEPRHDKTIDFARIFECRNGRVADKGTSVFSTDHTGAYTGNMLAPEAARLEAVQSKCPGIDINRVARALLHVIEEVYAPYYNGIIGVDMLACADGRLDPVVEVNMRNTMGYVANEFFERHMHEGSRGTFSILNTRGKVYEGDNYTTSAGRLLSGKLSLTCPNPYFTFLADTYII